MTPDSRAARKMTLDLAWPAMVTDRTWPRTRHGHKPAGNGRPPPATRTHQVFRCCKGDISSKASQNGKIAPRPSLATAGQDQLAEKRGPRVVATGAMPLDLATSTISRFRKLEGALTSQTPIISGIVIFDVSFLTTVQDSCVARSGRQKKWRSL